MQGFEGVQTCKKSETLREIVDRIVKAEVIKCIWLSVPSQVSLSDRPPIYICFICLKRILLSPFSSFAKNRTALRHASEIVFFLPCCMCNLYNVTDHRFVQFRTFRHSIRIFRSLAYLLLFVHFNSVRNKFCVKRYIDWWLLTTPVQFRALFRCRTFSIIW